MPEENNPEISYEQSLQYAKEVSSLYRQEKDKRKKLEEVNLELDKLRKQLELENNYLREELNAEQAVDPIIGDSSAIKQVLKEVELVAKSDAMILISGETGTGKELLAKAIHDRSKRKNSPLIKVNCGAIPNQLFESEFFGHIKGAFTGATKDRVGRFQLAHKGTLFLDEVSEIPMNLQSKMLRVLQDGRFEQVGNDQTKYVDVRIIAATNRDLQTEVVDGNFREDLFYRLNVIPIQSPPLRDRKEDIGLLANYFTNSAVTQFEKKGIKLTDENILLLQSYSWPGNIRELRNVIERAVLTSEDNNLYFRISSKIPTAVENEKPSQTAQVKLSEDVLKNQEKEVVLAALEKTNWKVYGKRGAGELLGILPATLAYRIKKLGLHRPD
jgi:transcriptional regulator with GAF, ATPase, and Fis domain